MEQNPLPPIPDRRSFMKASAALAGAAFLAKQAEGREAPPILRVPRMVLRPSAQRGHADHGWLDARHSFSFAGYRDPRHMGFRNLLVLNEDRISAARGFPMHPHDNMEIITWVLDGSLEHRDSLGNGSLIRPGDVQRMSAGRGIRHSEFNPAEDKATHLVQIWLAPTERGIKPSYEQERLPQGALDDALVLVAGPTADKGVVEIHTDTRLYAGKWAAGAKGVHVNRPGRHVWVQILRGSGTIAGNPASAGDGLRTSDAGRIDIEAGPTGLEALVFDLA